MLSLLPELLKGLPWLAALFCFSMWQWDRAALAEGKAAAEAAVISAQKKADAIGNELIIAQAQAMAVTQQKVVTYIDRIQASPDDIARNVAGSNGVRDIIGGGVTKGAAGPPAGVSGPATGGGPR